MRWSKPRRGMIVQRNDDGEIVDVRLLRSRAADGAAVRSFECCGPVWYDTLDLARKYGWRPIGVLPAEEAVEAWASAGVFDDSFQPRLRPYVKQVRTQDAAALADALILALGDPVEMLMLRVAQSSAGSPCEDDRLSSAHRALSPEFLRDFIGFLRAGPFVFAWRDL
jgi:hypothetical protein